MYTFYTILQKNNNSADFDEKIGFLSIAHITVK